MPELTPHLAALEPSPEPSAAIQPEPERCVDCVNGFSEYPRHAKRDLEYAERHVCARRVGWRYLTRSELHDDDLWTSGAVPRYACRSD